MRDHGATVGDYGGVRLITGAASSAHPGGLSLGFIEPGLVGVGSTALVRTAIDLKHGGRGVTTNDDIMKRVRSLDVGDAWVVGRFEALASQANLPRGLAAQLLPITWFAASAHLNGGLRGALRAETRDEASASTLRDLVRGFLAFAKLQAGSRPELQTLVQSVDLGGTGTDRHTLVQPPLGDVRPARRRDGAGHCKAALTGPASLSAVGVRSSGTFATCSLW